MRVVYAECMNGQWLWMFPRLYVPKGTTHKTTCLNVSCISRHWHIFCSLNFIFVYLASYGFQSKGQHALCNVLVIHSPVLFEKFLSPGISFYLEFFPTFMSQVKPLTGLLVWTCRVLHIIDTYFTPWISCLFILPANVFRAKGNIH